MLSTSSLRLALRVHSQVSKDGFPDISLRWVQDLLPESGSHLESTAIIRPHCMKHMIYIYIDRL